MQACAAHLAGPLSCTLRILFVADVYSRTGRRAASEYIPKLIREREIDLCIVNGENAAGGFGLTERIARKMFAYGADVITSGNHVWDRKEFIPYLNKCDKVLRPLNYPPGTPGSGSVIVQSRTDVSVAVVNIQGRTHLPSIDCPFRLGRAEVERLREQCSVVFVDFHAEATAEKMAMGWHLDGIASAVIGTHTHIQTADERILPNGTAYLTDAGMTGPHDSVIGVQAPIAIQRFLAQVHVKFKPAEENPKLCGALVEVDDSSGRATSIERLQIDVVFDSSADDGDEE